VKITTHHEKAKVMIFTHTPVCRVWQVHAQAFFEKAFCAHQNRSIARGSIGPTKSFAPDFQGRSHDIFLPNLS